MEIGIGLFLALAVGVLAAATGLDRERAFYSTVLIVVGSYYVLFAAMAGSAPLVGVETVLSLVFVAAALVGFRKSPWIVVLGLAAHGLLDLGHGFAVDNPGVPRWWPDFCMAYDLAAAAILAVRLWRPRFRDLVEGERAPLDEDPPYFRLLREPTQASPFVEPLRSAGAASAGPEFEGGHYPSEASRAARPFIGRSCFDDAAAGRASAP